MFMSKDSRAKCTKTTVGTSKLLEFNNTEKIQQQQQQQQQQ